MLKVPPRKLVWLALFCTCACGPEPTSPPPKPWTGFFHPPGKPGGSITNFKQCECRACDPGSCCSAEKTENLEAAGPECLTNDYNFSVKCGITVQTCTPRCYSHVWRIPQQESCSADLPLVCCG